MAELLIEEKSVAVPGEAIAKGSDMLPGFGTYRDGDQIICCRLGTVSTSNNVVKVVPLSGVYDPKEGDTIIACVADVLMSGWRLDFNTPYQAVLMVRDASSRFIEKGEDLTRILDIGDYAFMKITNVTSQKLIDVSLKGPGLKRLDAGRVFKVNPFKVPRIIGKQGSMVQMIKKYTNCQVLVGQNGMVWVQGSPQEEVLAHKVIRKIEEEAHIPGLTDRIKAFLEEITGKKVEDKE